MEFLRAIGPVFNFLLLALALIFFTRKQIRKLFQERRDRIADALGRAADAQDQAVRPRLPRRLQRQLLGAG